MKCDGSGDDDDDGDLYGSFDMLSLLFNQLCCAIDCMLAICGYFMFSSCIIFPYGVCLCVHVCVHTLITERMLCVLKAFATLHLVIGER